MPWANASTGPAAASPIQRRNCRKPSAILRQARTPCSWRVCKLLRPWQPRAKLPSLALHPKSWRMASLAGTRASCASTSPWGCAAKARVALGHMARRSCETMGRGRLRRARTRRRSGATSRGCADTFHWEGATEATCALTHMVNTSFDPSKIPSETPTTAASATAVAVAGRTSLSTPEPASLHRLPPVMLACWVWWKYLVAPRRTCASSFRSVNAQRARVAAMLTRRMRG
mmetsp:Transcript_21071/g.56556  ORF Transcript_21071/g.56556 Transcript_21071/m.56556 type:complete len:230 (+) Transcript_21071:194-883(+)